MTVTSDTHDNYKWNRLAASAGGRGEALRLAIESGLPLVKDRLRARKYRARTEAQ